MQTTKRAISAILVCMILLSCVPNAFAVDKETLPSAFYLTQQGRSTCTLCSVTMMIRSAMKMNGDSSWHAVTEENVRPVAWLNRYGLRWAFRYKLGESSVKVSHRGIDGVTVQSLKKLLDEHPEGIVLYCGKLPHAVFLLGYQDDTFYCAETVSGFSGKAIPLEKSTLGTRYGSLSKILKNVTAYWYVDDYQKNVLSCQCQEIYAGTYRTTDQLRIRSGHGTNYTVLGSIPAGATVTVSQAAGGWAHILYEEINGYASMEYLTLVSATHSYETQKVEQTCETDGYTLHTCTGCEGSYKSDVITSPGHTYSEWTQEDLTTQQRVCSQCEQVETRNAQQGTVNTDDLKLRAGAGTTYRILDRLQTGDRVTILEQKQVGSMTWGHTPDGWVCMQYVDLDTAEQTPEEPEEPVKLMGTITADVLRIREKAGTGNRIVGFYKNGHRIEVLEQTLVGTVTWGRTQDGWVSMDYVKLDEIQTPTPKEETPPVETPEEPPVETPEAPEEPAPEEPEQPVNPEAPTTVTGTINTDWLRIREDAGTSHRILGFYHTGHRVEILEQKTVKDVLWGKTEKGWISLDYVDLDSTEEVKEETPLIGVIINCGTLRIRADAGTTHAIVGYLKCGAIVKILEQKPVGSVMWGRILNGWISLEYVKFN